MPEQKVEVELPESFTKLTEKLEALGAQIAKLAGTQVETGALTPELTLLKAEFTKAERELAQVRAEFQQELEKSTKELNESRIEVTKIRLQRRREQFIKRVQGLASLPGAPADDFAEILDYVEQGLQKSIPEKAPAMFEKLNTLLTSWNEIIKKSALFAEVGRSEIAAFTGAEGKLVALAKAAQQADPNRTYEQHYDKVMRDHPELYRQYLQEKGGK